MIHSNTYTRYLVDSQSNENIRPATHDEIEESYYDSAPEGHIRVSTDGEDRTCYVDGNSETYQVVDGYEVYLRGDENSDPWPWYFRPRNWDGDHYCAEGYATRGEAVDAAEAWSYIVAEEDAKHDRISEHVFEEGI